MAIAVLATSSVDFACGAVVARQLQLRASAEGGQACSSCHFRDIVPSERSSSWDFRWSEESSAFAVEGSALVVDPVAAVETVGVAAFADVVAGFVFDGAAVAVAGVAAAAAVEAEAVLAVDLVLAALT